MGGGKIQGTGPVASQAPRTGDHGHHRDVVQFQAAFAHAKGAGRYTKLDVRDDDGNRYEGVAVPVGYFPSGHAPKGWETIKDKQLGLCVIGYYQGSNIVRRQDKATALEDAPPLMMATAGKDLAPASTADATGRAARRFGDKPPIKK